MLHEGGLDGSAFGRRDIIDGTLNVLLSKAGRFYHEAHEQVEALFKELQKAESQAENLLKANATAQEQLLKLMELGGSQFEVVNVSWIELSAKKLKLRTSIEDLRTSLAQIIQAK